MNHSHNSAIRPQPEPQQNPAQRCARALFLDVDGTLLQIAIGPAAVAVPARTRLALRTAVERESGAVALVSGRAIAAVDRLFAPSLLPTIGVHGLEWRDSAGRYFAADIATGSLDPARRRIRTLVAANTGLQVEDKRFAIAVHFRMAPHLQPRVQSLLDELALELQPHFRVQAGKCCLELRPAPRARRPAIEAFMEQAPFAGRMPVFIGDDATDEQGFEAVNAMDGISIHVGNRPDTAARWQLPNVNAVVRWLMAPTQVVARAM